MTPLIIKGAKEMQRYGAECASSFLKGGDQQVGGFQNPSRLRRTPFKKGRKKAAIIALEGDLGAGKTTFSQGFLKALGVSQKVISPTFIIIRRHTITKKGPFDYAFHIDCYRLEKPKELLALSLKQIMDNPRHIILIEWPELIKKYLPRSTKRIKISHRKEKNERSITATI